MEITIGYHIAQQPDDIKGFLTWINSLKMDAVELFVIDGRGEKDEIDLLKSYPFLPHVQCKTNRFSEHGKAYAYNHVVFHAKHPMVMFVTEQHRFDSADIQDMLKLGEDSQADVVVAPIKHEGLPWHQRRVYPRSFEQAKTIFDDPFLLASFTDTIYGKLYKTSFLKHHKVHFAEFDSMLGIPFLCTAFAYKARVAYAHWLSLPLGEEVFEKGNKDIFKALDRIMQLYKRLHIDDLFAKELNYLILRKIVVNNVLFSKELPKEKRKQLTMKCKDYIKRRGISWDNPYFASDDKWLRLNLMYVKMMIG
jgi:hypothetical protein